MKILYRSTLIVSLIVIFLAADVYARSLKAKHRGPLKFRKDLSSLKDEMRRIKTERLTKPVPGNKSTVSRSLRKAPAPFTVNSYDPGTLDSSFGTNGSSRINIDQGSWFDDRAHAIAIQPDGKIVLAGQFIDATISYIGFAIARFDTNGTVDNSFGINGSATTQISGGAGMDFCYAAAIQPDGKIVAAGFSADEDTLNAFAVARFNSNGTIDNTFGTNGSVRTNIAGGGDDVGFSVAIRSSGKIVVGGYSNDLTGLYAFGLAQFNEDGSLDNTFGTNGTTRTFLSGSGGFEDECTSIAIQPDGKIVAVGYSADADSNWAFAVARFNSNGALDSTFGTNGSATTFIYGSSEFDDMGNAVVIQTDGRIVVAGHSADPDTLYTFAVARFDSNGTIDNTFGTNGTVSTFINGGDFSYDDALAVALQENGKIVAAGTSDNLGYTGFAVARFQEDGTPDNSFGTSGSIRTSIGGGGGIFDEGNAVAIQSDGKILVSGFSSDLSFFVGFAVARFFGDSPSLPLPVEISSLNVEYRMPNVELKWKTATEVNNAGWEVQRSEIRGQMSEVGDQMSESAKGRVGEWVKAGFVEGNGNTNSPKEYSFVDKNLKAGKYSYRLKQIDNDGKFKYSQVVEVMISQMPQIFSLEQNYPNPFNPTTTIGFTLQVSGMTTLKIYDAIGREVATLVNEHLEAGVYHQRTFDARNLASGMYFARLQNDGKQLMKKLLLIK